MINTRELRGQIVKQGLSQRKMAKILGITEKTFYSKMREGVFRTDELETIADALQIQKRDIGILFCGIKPAGGDNFGGCIDNQ